MPELIVCKYGGSSITCQEDIERIKRITSDDMRRRVVVVSAPGRRSKDDVKVTDMLIELARTKSRPLLEKIVEKYQALCPCESMGGLARKLQQRISRPIEHASYLDAVKSFGEEACAVIVARAMGAEFVSPKGLLLVSEDYGNAKILPESENMIRKKLLGKRGISVVPGFYGYTKSGNIATFSRGGSDITGAYINASLEASVYENFTDTDGIYAASPEIVESPKKIGIITFDEIRDLAYSGFKVFHETAMHPVGKKRIPVHVRNTFTYPAEGTYIVHDRLTEPNQPIAGVAYSGGLCSFDAAVFGLNNMLGIGRKVLQIFEDEAISVEFITTGIDDISVILKEEQIAGHPNKIGLITNRLYAAIGQEASIKFQEHLGSLVVAGKGLKGTKGISANIQMTLAEADINIKFISQGPLERCIIYGIEHRDGKKAVNAIYDKYIR